MDLTEIQLTPFHPISSGGNTNQQPSLTNYIAPNDQFYSLNITYPINPTKVPLNNMDMMEQAKTFPLPITPPSKEGYVNIDDLKSDSYVELTHYKMNYPGQGSLVDLTKILEQLELANIPVGKPTNGKAIYENFADLEKDTYTEESILFHYDGIASRFYIASLSIVGLLILYRMMKL